MVFQNPFDTLNPSHSIGGQIIRVLEKFRVGKNNGEREQRMLELLDLVKLPRAFARRMPRQLSGGQKQRIGIARAFAGDAAGGGGRRAGLRARRVGAGGGDRAPDGHPAQAPHDDALHQPRPRLVRYLADRVMVMYLGHVVEIGTTDQVFGPPYHPYTEALLSAVPIADTSRGEAAHRAEGDIPSAMNPPPGCPFQTRCPRKAQVPGNLCETEVPPMRELGPGTRSSATCLKRCSIRCSRSSAPPRRCLEGTRDRLPRDRKCGESA